MTAWTLKGVKEPSTTSAPQCEPPRLLLAPTHGVWTSEEPSP